MTDTSQMRLAYIAESTEGTTPSTPAFTVARITGESLAPNIAHASSDEIRADGNVPDLTQVGMAAGGNVNFELSYGSFDDWLESLLRSAWSSNVLKNGVTPKSFTLEKTIEAGSTDQYHRFTGARANSMSLAIRANDKVTGSFGFMARTMTTAQAIITGATYTAANTNPIINAATNFASLTMTGVTSPEVTSLNLNINSNTRHKPVVGSLGAKGIGQGQFVVTGDMDVYFETNDLYDLFLAGTGSDLSFRLGGDSTLKYDFVLGTIKFTGGQVIAGGNGQDVMANMQFQALYDSSDAATLKITRTPAA